MKDLSIITIFFVAAFFSSCKNETLDIASSAEAPLNKQYSQIPREEVYADATLLTEMQNRYKTQMSALKTEIEKTGAKMVVTYLTPEVGNSLTVAQRQGKPFIEGVCKELNLDYYDLTKRIKDMDAKVITQMPKDGHWSKAGAKEVAADLAEVVKKYDGHQSTATYTDKPALMGALEPNKDEVLDGGKDLPYRLQTNAQGLRMNYNLDSEKKKQRILLMGDSVFFFPFLDNNDMGSKVLQDMYPNKEILNTAYWGYSIDDYVSLFTERCKYAQPDVVIVQTSGTDISDMFFSNRNHLSRKGATQEPNDLEKAFYTKTYERK